MSRQVWKYVLPLPTVPAVEVEIKLPVTHKVVHVGMDTNTGYPSLWIEVPTNGEWSDAVNESFVVVATGQDIPTTLANPAAHSGPCSPDCLYCDRPVESKRVRYAHIGTAVDSSFGWVWHVYQKFPTTHAMRLNEGLT